MAPSRSQAEQLIDSGRVLVAGAPAERAARLVSPAEPITLSGPPARYVSRGGAKLAAALDRFDVDPAGRRALDAGASTGGFTDCLLQRGASRVVAADVGRGQLHERLSADPRVLGLERVNVRTASLDDLGGIRFDLVVADLSFISLRAVAAGLVTSTEPAGDLVVLVKPQFEAGRAEATRGRGIIRDPAVWRSSLAGVVSAFGRAGATMMGVMVSPLRGADGNVEFLAHFRPTGLRPDLAGTNDVEATLDSVVAEAAGEGRGAGA